MKKTAILFAFTILLSQFAFAQVDEKSELFIGLEKMDKIIFDEGFNKCNLIQLESVLHKDLEFLHDQNGIQNREQFLTGFKASICSNANYKPIRKLVKGSLKVYPLKNNGKLYAAIQQGEHEFYISEPKKELYLTSTAKFTSIWFLENGRWILKRVLSYDHQEPKKRLQ